MNTTKIKADIRNGLLKNYVTGKIHRGSIRRSKYSLLYVKAKCSSEMRLRNIFVLRDPGNELEYEARSEILCRKCFSNCNQETSK